MKLKIIIASFIITILLSACGEKIPASPTPDIYGIHTAAAKTVIAELTQSASMHSPTPKPSRTATQSAFTATSVPTSIQPTETFTLTPSPSPTAAPTDEFCDNAAWISDISVPDKTEMSPGQNFEKVWLIQNTGTCTWTSGYQLAFGYGENLNGQARPLSADIFPNESVEVTVVFAAPITTGEYQSYWRMINAAGANFGEFFYVDIVVR